MGARDHSQSTLLHLATCEGSLGAAQLLLDHGADVHVRDEKGGTPLHDATWGGYIEVMELLLAQGADVNAQSNRGVSALHLASFKGGPRRNPVIAPAWRKCRLAGLDGRDRISDCVGERRGKGHSIAVQL